METSQSQIHSLYELTGNNDIENLRGFIIFTTGNENGINPINVENLKGFSVYHYKNGKLEHSIYVKDNSGKFNVIPQLTAFSLGTAIPELDYAVYASGLYHNTALSSYFIPNDLSRNFEYSYDLMETRAITVGQIVSLENIPNQETKTLMQQLTRAQICPKYCGNANGTSCNHSPSVCTGDRSTGLEPVDESLEPTDGGGSGGIDDPKICSKQHAYSKVDSSLRNNFNFPLAYEIRDNALSNFVFGMKYRSYYYETSFYKVNLSTEDAVKVALLLPKLYSLYDN